VDKGTQTLTFDASQAWGLPGCGGLISTPLSSLTQWDWTSGNLSKRVILILCRRKAG